MAVGSLSWLWHVRAAGKLQRISTTNKLWLVTIVCPLLPFSFPSASSPPPTSAGPSSTQAGSGAAPPASTAAAAGAAAAPGGPSRYRGVVWHKSNCKWEARVYEGGKQRFLGYFTSEDAAAHAYDEYSGGWVGEWVGDFAAVAA